MIKIENGIPMPAGHVAVSGELAELRRALGMMAPGDSFTYHNNKNPYVAAKALGVKITVRKIDGEYRVWLREGAK